MLLVAKSSLQLALVPVKRSKQLTRACKHAFPQKLKAKTGNWQTAFTDVMKTFIKKVNLCSDKTTGEQASFAWKRSTY